MKPRFYPGCWFALGCLLIITVQAVTPDAGPSQLDDPCIAATCEVGKICAYPSCTASCSTTCLDPADDMCEAYPDLCHNGFCLRVPGSFQCICNEGFMGKYCHLQQTDATDPCETSPCVNGGTCSRSDSGSFQCRCTANFFGTRCETALAVANFSICLTHFCGAGQLCVPVIETCAAGNCPLRPICVDIKAGTCPYSDPAQAVYDVINESGTCDTGCLFDINCLNSQKCCMDGCSAVCRDPENIGVSFCEQKKTEYANVVNTYQSLRTVTNVTFGELVGRLENNAFMSVVQSLQASDPSLDFRNQTVAEIINRNIRLVPFPRITCSNGNFDRVQCDYFVNLTRSSCYCVDQTTGARQNTVASPESSCTGPAQSACSSSPCLNDASCQEAPLSPGGFYCLCQSGYTGQYCGSEWADDQGLCSNYPCVNRGTCQLDSLSSMGFNCICPPGYTGQYCETESAGALCGAQPCVNGTCHEDARSLTGYSCSCDFGYYGVKCDQHVLPENYCDKAEASYSLCQHGRCQTSFQRGFQCECDTGYIGIRCDRDVVKPGLCPAINGQDLWSGITSPDTACTSQCRSDSECNGQQRCCLVGCNSQCTQPESLDVSTCRQQKLIQDQTWTLMRSLGSIDASLTISRPFIETKNNTHLVQLIAALTGSWSMEYVLTQFGQMTYQSLANILPILPLPKVSCTDMGKFERIQCSRHESSSVDSSCYCVRQTGIIDKSNFILSVAPGANESSCTSETTEYSGSLQLSDRVWDPVYTDVASPEYLALKLEVINWAIRGYTNTSSLWAHFSDIDFLGFVNHNGFVQAEFRLKFEDVISLEKDPYPLIIRTHLLTVHADQLRDVLIMTPLRDTPVNFNLELSLTGEPSISCPMNCTSGSICVYTEIQCFSFPCFPHQQCIAKDENACENAVCFNGGTCVVDTNSNSGFICRCPNGYKGGICHIEEQVSTCADSPCQNSGLCVVQSAIGSPVGCRCPAGYTGRFCEKAPDNVCIFSTCAKDEYCVPDKMCPENEDCLLIPKCIKRSVGFCPAVNITSVIINLADQMYYCAEQCNTDGGCPFSKKCCSQGPCRSACVEPLVGLSNCELQQQVVQSTLEMVRRLSTYTRRTFGDYLQGLSRIGTPSSIFAFDDLAIQFLKDKSLGEAVVRFSAVGLENTVDLECSEDGSFAPMQCKVDSAGNKANCYCVDVKVGIRVGAEFPYSPTETRCSEEKLGSCPAVTSGADCTLAVPSCTKDMECSDSQKCCPTDCGSSQCKDPVDPCSLLNCENNGYCERSPFGETACVCPERYSGDNCEISPPSPCDLNPCLNGDPCEVVAGNLASCICPFPTYGRLCERSYSVTDPCQSTSCDTGEVCLVTLVCSGTPEVCSDQPTCNGGASLAGLTCAPNDGEIWCPATAFCYADQTINHRCVCREGFSGDNCQDSVLKSGACPPRNLTRILSQKLAELPCDLATCSFEFDCLGTSKCCDVGDSCGKVCVEPLSDLTRCEQVRQNASAIQGTITFLEKPNPTTLAEFVDKLDPDLLEEVYNIYQGADGTSGLARLAKVIGDVSFSDVFSSWKRIYEIPTAACAQDGRFESVQCRRFANDTIISCTCVNVLNGRPWGPKSKDPLLDCTKKPGTCPASPSSCEGTCSADNECSDTKKCCENGCGAKSCYYPTELGCANNQCMNGECVQIGLDDYACLCNSGFTGQYCQTSVGTACSRTPSLCLNGGSCFSIGFYDFSCSCNFGYTGKNCENYIPTTPADPGNPTANPTDPPGRLGRVSGEITVNREWITALSNNSSSEYKQFANDLSTQLFSALKNSSLGDYINGVNITSMRNGSIIVNITLLLEPGVRVIGLGDGTTPPPGGISISTNEIRNVLQQEQDKGLLSQDIDIASLKLTSWTSLAYCQRYPYVCGNGGSCQNIGSNNFACHCPPGYYGSLCQHIHVSTTTPAPTACQNIACPSGEHCVSDKECHLFDGSETCRDQIPRCKADVSCKNLNYPCYNNGMCLPDNTYGLYRCACPSGFIGQYCERREPTRGVCPPTDHVKLLNNILSSPLSMSFGCVMDTECNPGFKCCSSETGSSCVQPLYTDKSLCEQAKLTLDMVNETLANFSLVDNIKLNQLIVYLQDKRVENYVAQLFQMDLAQITTGLQSLQNYSIGEVINMTRPYLALPFPNCTDDKSKFTGVQCLKYLNGTDQLCYCVNKSSGEKVGDKTSHYPWKPQCYQGAPQYCESNMCLNGGICRVAGSSYRCDCPCGYVGDRCQTSYAFAPGLCQTRNCPPGYKCVVEQECKDTGPNSQECKAQALCKAPASCESNPCLFGGSCVSDLPNGYKCNCREGFMGKNCGTIERAPGICPKYNMVYMLNNIILSPSSFQVDCSLDSSCIQGQKCCASETGASCVVPLFPEASLCQQRWIEFNAVNESLHATRYIQNITYGQLLNSPVGQDGLNAATQIFQVKISEVESLRDTNLGTLMNMSIANAALPYPNCSEDATSFLPVQCVRYLNGTNTYCYCADKRTGDIRGSHFTQSPWKPSCPPQDEDFCGSNYGICLNGGSCRSSGSGYSCVCVCNFYGEHCELHKDQYPGVSSTSSYPQNPCQYMDCAEGYICEVTDIGDALCMPKTVKVSGVITLNMEWDEALYDKSSPQYKNLAKLLSNQLMSALKNSSLGKHLLVVNVTSMKSGSIIVNIELLFGPGVMIIEEGTTPPPGGMGISVNQIKTVLKEKQANGELSPDINVDSLQFTDNTPVEDGSCPLISISDVKRFIDDAFNPSVSCNSECSSNRQCGPSQKCCTVGCKSRCVQAVQLDLSPCEKKNQTMLIAAEAISVLKNYRDRSISDLFTAARNMIIVEEIGRHYWPSWDVSSLIRQYGRFPIYLALDMLNKNYKFTTAYCNEDGSYVIHQCSVRADGTIVECFCVTENGERRSGTEGVSGSQLCRDISTPTTAPTTRGTTQGNDGNSISTTTRASTTTTPQDNTPVEDGSCPLISVSDVKGFIDDAFNSSVSCISECSSNIQCGPSQKCCTVGCKSRCVQAVQLDLSPCEKKNHTMLIAAEAISVSKNYRDRPISDLFTAARNMTIVEEIGRHYWPSWDVSSLISQYGRFPIYLALDVLNKNYEFTTAYCYEDGSYVNNQCSVRADGTAVVCFCVTENGEKRYGTEGVSGSQACRDISTPTTAPTTRGTTQGNDGNSISTTRRASTTTTPQVGQSLRLVPGDQVQPKHVGSGLIVKCDATNLGPGEDPQLTWTSAQGIVITSTDPTDTVFVQGLGSQSLKLRINSVHRGHAGKWTCRGVLNGQIQTKHVFFDVWDDISFEGERKQRPTIYTDALIKCRVSGSPQPEVTWSHNNVDLEKGRYIQTTEGLQIVNISKADNGIYLCKAEIDSRGRYEEYEIEVEVNDNTPVEDGSCPLISVSDVKGFIDDAFNSSVSCISECSSNIQCGPSQKCCTVGCKSRCVQAVQLDLSPCEKKNHTMLIAAEAISVLKNYRDRSISDLFTAARNMIIVEEIGRHYWPSWDVSSLISQYGRFPIYLALDVLNKNYEFKTAYCYEDGSYVNNQCSVRADGTIEECFCVTENGERRYGTEGVSDSQGCRDVTCKSIQCRVGQCLAADDYGGYVCVPPAPTKKPPTECELLACADGYVCGGDGNSLDCLVEAFTVPAEITLNRTWSDKLNDPTSPEYQQIANELNMQLMSAISNSDLFGHINAVNIISMRNGSVIVVIDVKFAPGVAIVKEGTTTTSPPGVLRRFSLEQIKNIFREKQDDGTLSVDIDIDSLQFTAARVCGPVCLIYCPYGNVLDENQCPTCKCNEDNTPVEDGSCPLISVSDVKRFIDDAFNPSVSCNSECSSNSQCGPSQKCCTVGCKSRCVQAVQLDLSPCEKKNHTMLIAAEAISVLENYRDRPISDLFTVARNMTIVEEIGRHYWPSWDVSSLISQYGRFPIYLALDMLNKDYKFTTAYCYEDGSYVNNQCSVRADGTIVECFCVTENGEMRYSTEGVSGSQACRDVSCKLIQCRVGQQCLATDDYGGYICDPSAATKKPPTECELLACADGYVCGGDGNSLDCLVEAFTVPAEITLNRTWSDKLNHPTSPEYQQIANELNMQLMSAISNSDLFGHINAVNIISMRNGSVIVMIHVKFAPGVAIVKEGTTTTSPPGVLRRFSLEQIKNIFKEKQDDGTLSVDIDIDSLQFTAARVCGPVCLIYCPYGNVLDENQCPTCKCNEGISTPTVPTTRGTTQGNDGNSISTTTRASTTKTPQGCVLLTCSNGCQSGHVLDGNGCVTCPCVAECENFGCSEGYECRPIESGICLPKPIECSISEVRCIEKEGNQEICVLTDFVCDGDQDCEDGSDEANCPIINECAVGTRKCESGEKCVIDDRWCDGLDDCSDGSDENSCPDVILPGEITLNREWDEALSDKSSPQFIQLADELSNQIMSALKNSSLGQLLVGIRIVEMKRGSIIVNIELLFGPGVKIIEEGTTPPPGGMGITVNQIKTVLKEKQANGELSQDINVDTLQFTDNTPVEDGSCPLISVSDVKRFIDDAFNPSVSCNSECSSNSQCGPSQKCCTVGCKSRCVQAVQLDLSPCEKKNHTMLIAAEAISVLENYRDRLISDLFTAALNMTIVEEIGRHYWPSWDVSSLINQYGRFPIYLALDVLNKNYKFTTAYCNEDSSYANNQCSVRGDGTIVECFCVTENGEKRSSTEGVSGRQGCRDISTPSTSPTTRATTQGNPNFTPTTTTSTTTLLRTTPPTTTGCLEPTCSRACRSGYARTSRGCGTCLCIAECENFGCSEGFECRPTESGTCLRNPNFTPTTPRTTTTPGCFQPICFEACQSGYARDGQGCETCRCVAECENSGCSEGFECRPTESGSCLRNPNFTPTTTPRTTTPPTTTPGCLEPTCSRACRSGYARTSRGCETCLCIAECENFGCSEGFECRPTESGTCLRRSTTPQTTTHLTTTTSSPRVPTTPPGCVQPTCSNACQSGHARDGNGCGTCRCVAECENSGCSEGYECRPTESGICLPKPIECSIGEVRCIEKGGNQEICVQTVFVCDGDQDCEDDSDEANCPIINECAVGSSKCEDGEKCVIDDRWCDGLEDCFDGSDENSCPEVKLPGEITLNRDWNEALSDKSSPEFKQLADELSNQIMSALKNSSLGQLVVGIRIVDMRNGSIIVNIELLFGPGVMIIEEGTTPPPGGMGITVNQIKTVLKEKQANGELSEDINVDTLQFTDNTPVEDGSCPLISISDVKRFIDDAFNPSVSCNSECSSNSQCGLSQKCCTVGCKSRCVQAVQLDLSPCEKKNHTMLIAAEAISVLENYRTKLISDLITAGRNMTIVEEIGRQYLPSLDADSLISQYGRFPIFFALDFLNTDYEFTTAYCNEDGSYVNNQCSVRADGTIVECFCVSENGEKRYSTEGVSGRQGCRDVSCKWIQCRVGQQCQATDDYGGYVCDPTVTTKKPPTPCEDLACADGYVCRGSGDSYTCLVEPFTVPAEITLNRTWSDKLNDRTSTEYQQIAGDLHTQLMRAILGTDLSGYILAINIVGMRNGSVKVIIDLSFGAGVEIVKEGTTTTSPPGILRRFSLEQIKNIFKEKQTAGVLSPDIDVDSLQFIGNDGNSISTTTKASTTATTTPQGCVQPTCSNACQSGYARDGNGCETCRCVAECENLGCSEGYECRPTESEICLPKPIECSIGEVRCRPIEKGGNQEICVQTIFVCDGDQDCEDGSDEANCPITNECAAGTSKCENGEKCVIDDRWCDGLEDCSDGSDENSCPVKLPGEITLNRDWNEALSDKSSPEFIQLADELSNQLFSALKNSSLGELLVGVNIKDMRSGSIIVNIELLFGPGVVIIEEGTTPPPGEMGVTVNQIKTVLRKKQANGELPADLDIDAVQFTSGVTETTTKSSTITTSSTPSTTEKTTPTTKSTTRATTILDPVCPSISDCTTRCEFGRVLDGVNCPTCQCIDPCQSVECSEAENCVVYPNNTAACRTEKLGYCPRSEKLGGSCDRECRYDASCSGAQKCCSGSCGTFCVEALDSSPKTLTDCLSRRVEAYENFKHNPLAPLTIPRCDGAGNWMPIQCIKSWGICYCVDSNGEKILGSDTRGFPDCSASFNASAVIPVCESGKAIHQCDPILCYRSFCPRQANSRCLINPCGGCVAEEFDLSNNKVVCGENVLPGCESKTKKRVEAVIPAGFKTSVIIIEDLLRLQLQGRKRFSPTFDVANGESEYPVDFCGLEFSSSDSGDSKWFFNPETGQCGQAKWSGNGNLNVFNTEKDCQTQCQESATTAPSFKGIVVPICESDAGNSQNSAAKQCHHGYCWCSTSDGTPVPGSLSRAGLACLPGGGFTSFSLSACSDGTAPTICENSCEDQTCASNPASLCYADPCDNCRLTFTDFEGQVLNCELTPVCDLPQSEGTCYLNDKRWYYNKDKNACELFTFGGCNGNENNFLTRGACEAECYQLKNEPLCDESGVPSICEDGCRGEVCGFFPEAMCRVNICQDCQVEFYNPETNLKVNCDILNTKCQRERAWKKSLVVVSGHIPQCSEDDEYQPKQCDQSFCWCVDGEGDEIPGVRLEASKGQFLTCKQNKTVEGIMKFKLDVDFEVIEGKEEEFKLAIAKALADLLKSGSNILNIKVTRGSIVIEVTLVDTKDSDLSEVLNILETNTVQSQLMISFENETYIVNNTDYSLSRKFQQAPSTEAPPVTTPRGPDTTKVGTEVSEKDLLIAIIVGSVCGAIALALIIGCVVLYCRKQRKEKGSEIEYSDSGETIETTSLPRPQLYRAYPVRAHDGRLRWGAIPVDNGLYFSDPTGLPVDEYAHPEPQLHNIYPSMTTESE